MSDDGTILVAQFDYLKTTQNTYRFREIVADGESPKIGDLYIKQSVVGARLGKEKPKRIRVIVENVAMPTEGASAA